MMGILDFAFFQKSVDQVGAQVRALDKEIETAKRERDDLNVMAVSREDAITLLHKRIDDVASSYPEDLFRGMAGFVPGSKAHRLGESFPLGGLLPQANGAGVGMSAATLITALAYLLRDDLKKGVANAINAGPWPEQTISLADRAKRLEALDEKIEKLEAQANDMRNRAAGAGIILR